MRHTPLGRPHTAVENTYFPSRNFGEERLRATRFASSAESAARKLSGAVVAVRLSGGADRGSPVRPCEPHGWERVGLAFWLQRAPYSSGVMCGPAAGEGGAPQPGAECSELLMSVLQVVAAGLFEDRWAAGAAHEGDVN